MGISFTRVAFNRKAATRLVIKRTKGVRRCSILLYQKQTLEDTSVGMGQPCFVGYSVKFHEGNGGPSVTRTRDLPIRYRKHCGYGDTFFIDEVFVKINSKQHYLWRAVDQDGEVVDVFRQARRFLGAHAAVSNLFNLGRHLVRAEHYKNLRTAAFSQWSRAVA